MLKTESKVDVKSSFQDDLTTKDRGIARAVDRMIEGSTF